MSANQQVLAGLGGVPVGQYLDASALDNQTWVVPQGVTSISVVCVGPGAVMSSFGNGGCLRYVNNIAVTPGETLFIDNRENGGRLRRGSTVLCYGPSYNKRASAVGTGGNGGASQNPGAITSGGGGAGGYSGNGGSGGSTSFGALAGSGTGGGGAGGAGNTTAGRGGGGGGVGVFGEGASGVGGANSSPTPSGGAGGSGGTSGASGDSTTTLYPTGGSYGGGGGAYNGAVRIIWPGNLRQFPSTRTADE